MDGQSNNAVMMPDITDELTNKSESNENQSEGISSAVTVSSVDGVSVAPIVQEPVASLINVSSEGTTFDVITPDQLHLSSSGTLRPILCVDSSCMCEDQNEKDSSHRNSEWLKNENGHIRTAHIVIENDSLTLSNSTPSWLEEASLPVLPITCKSTNALLYKSKFGSGGKGKCIKLLNRWYTPIEFEAYCGRASYKNWKRSIRFRGRRLIALIDEGILRPHATCCTCAACCDDDSVMGPVRLLATYRRKKKKDPGVKDNQGNARKLKREGKDESNGDESYDSNNDLDSDGQIRVSLQQHDNSSVPVSQVSRNDSSNRVQEECTTQPVTLNESFNKLDKMASKLVKIIFQLRKEVDDAKAQWRAEKEQLQVEHKRDKEQAVLTARVEAQVACSRAVFDSTVHVVDPIATVGLQPSEDSNDNKKCANCNRDAFAECSMCRRTPYCSTFCQRKDWSSHQVECQVRTSEEGSIMLIVESASDQVLQVHE